MTPRPLKITIDFAGLVPVVEAIGQFFTSTIHNRFDHIEDLMATLKEQIEAAKAELLATAATEHQQVLDAIQANVDSKVAEATATLTARVAELEALLAAEDIPGATAALDALKADVSIGIDSISNLDAPTP